MAPVRAPLTLGELAGAGNRLYRSGIRWLRGDGQPCQRGDILGYCGINVEGCCDLGARFIKEEQDLQVALVAGRSGRLRHDADSSPGGWMDRLWFVRWQADDVVGHLEIEAGDLSEEPALALYCMTGRRVSKLVDDRSGILTGWHDRKRAWHASHQAPVSSIMALGICELGTIMLGERGAFVELMQGLSQPAHAIDLSDQPLVHSAAVLLGQLTRNERDIAAIAEDFSQLPDRVAGFAPEDWVAVASCVQALQRSPIGDRYDLVTRAGIETADPVRTIVLSLNSESAMQLRHRKLGYIFACHGYWLQRLGPAGSSWFRANFERLPYSIDRIRDDYRHLTAALREARPDLQILVLNAMSTLGGEQVPSYDAFDRPLGGTLRGPRSRELNAMLDDIARETKVAIVDVDAIGAELGSAAAIPDGVHQNGHMQAEVRAEIVSLMSRSSVPAAPRRFQHG